jgi:hypothetical protein
MRCPPMYLVLVLRIPEIETSLLAESKYAGSEWTVYSYRGLKPLSYTPLLDPGWKRVEKGNPGD